jgi:hypothetical protein
MATRLLVVPDMFGSLSAWKEAEPRGEGRGPSQFEGRESLALCRAPPQTQNSSSHQRFANLSCSLFSKNRRAVFDTAALAAGKTRSYTDDPAKVADFAGG